MRYRLVVVEWIDAQLVTDQTRLDELEKRAALATRHTTGWLVLDAEDRIAVASTWDKDDANVDGVWVIPKGWVKSIHNVSKSRARKTKEVPCQSSNA